MSNGLFFPGVVLKNNRDLLKEEEARQRLALDKERLELQKQQLAMQRENNRRQNAPKYKDFGKSNAGDLDFYIRGKKDEYIDWVGNNYEGDQNQYYTGKAKYESDILSDTEILSKINTDYTGNMADLEKGGESLDQANYVKDSEGVYEWEKRYRAGKAGLADGTLTPQEFADMYFDNSDNSLYLVREKTSLGQGVVDSWKGPKDSYLQDTADGKREIRGYNNKAKQAIYLAYKNELKFNKDGVFETPEGENAYFNSSTDNELNMIKFFKEEEGKLTVDENSPILTQLDPKSKDFDQELSNRYLNYLAKVETDGFMVDKVVNKAQSAKDDPYKDAYGVADWEKMLSSQNFTENKYGAHGRMLTDYNFTQNVGGEHDLQSSTFNNMEISDDANVSTDVAKKYIEEQLRLGNGKIKSKLSQVAISEDHTNMYGIYSIPVSNEATGGKGSMILEISVPIDNVDSKLLGPVPKRWYNSLAINRDGAYNQEKSTTTGGGAPRPQ